MGDTLVLGLCRAGSIGVNICRYQKSEMLSRIDIHVWMKCCFFVSHYLTQSTSVFQVIWRC